MSNVCPKCGTNEGISCIDHDLTGTFQIATPISIDEYATFTEEMWFSGQPSPNQLPPQALRELSIMTFGLAGETGEVIEHIKKLVRDGHIDREALKKELGDAGYYWARICRFFGFWPSEVISANVTKLESRRERGKLRGDGDDR